MMRSRHLAWLSWVLVAGCGASGSLDKGGSRNGPDTSQVDDEGIGGEGGHLDDDSRLGDDELTDVPPVVCDADRHGTTRHPVDIVFVVDNSGSMSDEIEHLRANINSFANIIETSGLDYRVFMISRKGTKSNGVCVPEPLASLNCETKEPLFYAIDQKIGSKDALSWLLATYDVPPTPFVSSYTNWNSFVRYDSMKILVALTDDDSNLDANAFEAQLFAKGPPGVFGDASNRKYVFDSIIGWDGTTALPTSSKCSTAAKAGLVYQELSARTGGVVESICKDDWTDIFNKIAQGVVRKLGCEFQLPEDTDEPLDPALIEVQLSLGGGAPSTLPRVLDVSACAAEPMAFYFDSNTAPTKVLLCPGACDSVGQDPEAALSVLVGCPAPPPR